MSSSTLRNPRLSAYRIGASHDPEDRGIPIVWRRRRLGCLAPALAQPNDAEVAQLADWRNRARDRFLSRTTVSTASTAAWLERIATSNDRILFLIRGYDDRLHGHIGLRDVDEAARLGETDAWLGADGTEQPGLAMSAFATLVAWSFAELGLERLVARVTEDNDRVLRAHLALGYRMGDPIASAVNNIDAVPTCVLELEAQNFRRDLWT